MLYARRDILRLLWPVLVEQTFAVVIGMLSTMMVAGVSEDAMAGVGLVANINYILMTTFTAVATGVTVVVAQRNGAGSYREAGEAAAESLTLVTYISAALGALMIIFSRPMLEALFPGAARGVLSAAELYLLFSSYSLPLQAIFSTIAGIMRASNNARTPMIGSVLSNVFYLAAALLTINVFHWGVAGAGWGLVASRLAPAAFLAVMLKRGGDAIFLPRLKFALNMHVLKPVLAIAVPAGIDALIFNGGKLVVQVFMAGMGTAVLAANAICNALTGFINLPGGTMQVVSITVVGRTFGAGLSQDAKRHMLSFTVWGCILEGAMCLAFWPFQRFFVNLFWPTQAAFDQAWNIMILALIATPLLWSASFILPNGLRALGDATFTMWVSVGSMLILRVFGSWFFGVHLGWGLWGIWFSMVVDWFGRGALFLPRALRWRAAPG